MPTKAVIKHVASVQKSPDVDNRNREMNRILQQSIARQSEIIEQIESSLRKGKRGSALPLIHKLEYIGVRHATLNRFYAIALGQQFQFYKKNWDALPKSFTQAHPEGCYGYIQERYGYGDQMADMYATVWEGLYSGKYIKPREVPNFVHLSEVPIAKQRVAAGYVIDGTMNKRRWQAVADESLDRRELVAELRKGSDKPRGGRHPDDQLVLIRETGDLRVYGSSGEIFEIGHLDIKSADPTILKYVRKIMAESNIRMRR